MGHARVGEGYTFYRGAIITPTVTSNGIGMSVSHLTSTSLRRHVLASYKMLLRLGQTWVADDPRNTAEERKYITAETKLQFRKNARMRTNSDQPETTNIDDKSEITNKNDKSVVVTNITESEITEMLREVEARVEMARHYKNPYPRAINLPPMGLAASLGKNRQLRGQKKLREQSVPIYVRSNKELD